MDKETRQAIETRDQVLEGIRQDLDSLTGSFRVFQNETDQSIAEMQEFQNSRPDSGVMSETNARMHDAAIEENARLHESIGRLEEKVNVLESPDHENDVIQKFLRDLDSDNYLEIGRKLGYLEETEASPEDLQNVEGAEPLDLPLGDNQVLEVQKEKPEDMTGWEFSETQGVYIRLKESE